MSAPVGHASVHFMHSVQPRSAASMYGRSMVKAKELSRRIALGGQTSAQRKQRMQRASSVGNEILASIAATSSRLGIQVPGARSFAKARRLLKRTRSRLKREQNSVGSRREFVIATHFRARTADSRALRRG